MIALAAVHTCIAMSAVAALLLIFVVSRSLQALSTSLIITPLQITAHIVAQIALT